MTQNYETAAPSEQTGSTAQAAKDQAAAITGSAVQSGAHLVGEAKAQAGEVGREAGRQVRVVLDQGRVQLTEQATQQQRKVVVGIRSLSGELGSMASASSEPGIASDVARQVATRADSLASWLDEREPGALLEEVKTFARDKPGTFLAIAAAAGLLAGRLTRGLKDGSSAPAPVGATHRAPGAATTTTGYGRESVAGTGYLTGSASSGAGVHVETASTGTGHGYPGGGLGTTAPPTTSGSSDDTMVFPTSGVTSAAYPDDTGRRGADGIYGEPANGTYGEAEAGSAGTESETAWPPVHGAGDGR